MLKIIKAKTSLGSNSPGTELAPDALFKAGLKTALQHNNLNFFETELTTKNQDILTEVDLLNNLPELIKLNRHIYNEALSGLNNKDKIVVLGGDHSVAIGSIFATKTFSKDAVVIYIDAHADSQSPSTSITGNIHGMPFATILGDSLYDNFGYPAYRKNEAVLLGVKDVDHAETIYLTKNKIKCFTIDNIIESGIGFTVVQLLKIIKNRPVHISLDIDVVDQEHAPGTGVINKGGLSYREIKYLCKKLSLLNILSIDLVEINPDKDVNTKTVELGIELLIDILGGEWSPYKKYLEDHKISN